jgi:hypothetical protein
VKPAALAIAAALAAAPSFVGASAPARAEHVLPQCQPVTGGWTGPKPEYPCLAKNIVNGNIYSCSRADACSLFRSTLKDDKK